MLKTEGRGRFCGVMLHVWNPRGGWWGEGDEKFFVDGEKFPSTFGTGSEDYFGYAWCHPGLFQRPFHAQTMTQDNAATSRCSAGTWPTTSPSRSRSKAASRSTTGPKRRAPSTPRRSAGTWPPAASIPTSRCRSTSAMATMSSPPIVAGGFKVLGEPAGQRARRRRMTHYGKASGTTTTSSGGPAPSPATSCEIAVPVEGDGTYDVSVVLTKARDYGIVSLSIDGQAIGQPIDLYNPQVIRSDAVALGTHRLEAGDHVLAVKIVGKNEKAAPGYMFGLDTLILAPQRP